MNKKHFVLIDMYNIFFRLVYAISEKDIELKSSFVLNSFFTMINYLGKTLNPDHFVVCAEGPNNWRKQLNPKYKLNRKEKMDKRTIREVKHDEKMLATLNEFLTFLKESTNVSVLQCEEAEADDMIARFCHLHPNDKITICSVDNDFIQLVNENISLYNGNQKVLITSQGVVDPKTGKYRQCCVDAHGKLTIKKNNIGTEELLQPNWQEYALFCKCIRGDSSDNIFPAYPRVKAKTSNTKGVRKIGLNEAFEHKSSQDFEWINFMNQTWKDENGEEHKVEDEYKKNQVLIDFNYIPDHYKNKFDEFIKQELIKPSKYMLKFGITVFFNRHHMIRHLDYINNFIDYLSRSYC